MLSDVVMTRKQCNHSVVYQSIPRITEHLYHVMNTSYEKFGQYPEYTPGGFYPVSLPNGAPNGSDRAKWDVYAVAFASTPELFGPGIPYTTTVHNGLIHMTPNINGDCQVVMDLLQPQVRIFFPSFLPVAAFSQTTEIYRVDGGKTLLGGTRQKSVQKRRRKK